MPRPENPKKKATRERLEANTRDNVSLPKNVTAATILSANLKFRALKVHGVDHPVFGSNFPIVNCTIKPTTTRLANRTNTSHILEFCISGDAANKSTTSKINLKDFTMRILEERPITHKGDRYLVVSLGPSQWSRVLLPISQRIWYR